MVLPILCNSSERVEIMITFLPISSKSYCNTIVRDNVTVTLSLKNKNKINKINNNLINNNNNNNNNNIKENKVNVTVTIS